jgi:hypothetical protein
MGGLDELSGSNRNIHGVEFDTGLELKSKAWDF